MVCVNVIFTPFPLLNRSISDDNNLFSLSNWPTPSDEVKHAISDMIEEGIWTPVPIPAYSKSGNLILPSEYEARLKGALVRVKVSISHQYLRSNKTDNYFADIREIWVLKNPPRVVASPGKRKLKDDMKDANKRRKKE